MLNKKAETGTTLGGTVTSVVIAVICILILIGLGVMIYNILVVSPDLSKAEATLKEVSSNIEAINSQGGSMEVVIANPNGWVLVSADSSNIPSLCGSSNCLCICKYDSNKQTFFNNCNDKRIATCTPLGEKKVQISSSVYSINYPIGISGINIDGIIKIKLSFSNNEINLERLS